MTSTWTAGERRAAVGLLALASLEGFEALAVVTAMPAVAPELHAVGAIALAFAVPLATSVLARSSAAGVMDRHGPAGGFRLGVLLFLIGLVGAAVAPSMPVFLAARALQGVGTGVTGVGLYVLVGREFSPAHRQRMLVLLTTAWILPALVGPAVAGIVTERFGWRWVFAGVVPLVVVASALVRPALSRTRTPPEGAVDARRTPDPAIAAEGGNRRPVTGRRGLAWSALASLGLLAATSVGQVPGRGGPLLLVLTVAVVLASASRLVPRGSWTGRLGLPSVLGVRSLGAAAYIGAESYLPLVLHDRHGVSLAAAGVVITSTALAWTAAAWVGDRMRVLADLRRRIRLGTGLVLVGTTGVLVAVDPAVPVAVIALLWAVGGAGMGLASSTSAALVLDLSPADAHGATSAAMQTNDVVAQVLLLAVGAAVFSGLVARTPTVAFGAVLVLAVFVAVAALALTTRLGGDRGQRDAMDRTPVPRTADRVAGAPGVEPG